MSDHSATHSGVRLPALLNIAPRFLLFPILAVIAQIALMAHGPSLPVFWQVVAIGGVGYFWFNVAGSFHEVVHHTLFQSRAANVWLGAIDRIVRRHSPIRRIRNRTGCIMRI